MSESNSEQPYAVLNLTADEKRAFAFLFDKADTDQLGVITGERAVNFFERTGIPSHVLGEIWGIADQENRGLLTKPGFSIALRLIGHYQAGKQPSPELAFQPAPVPKFEGLQLPTAPVPAPLKSPTSPSRGAFPPNALQPQNSGQGIRIPPLDPQKVAQYTGLFERSGAQSGLLDGLTAKAIFERAGLPVEVLGKIWTLADREQRGALDQTEFIVAMHLLTSMKSRAMTALPNTLPQGFYDAAARRGAPPPPPPQARQTGAAPRQFSGSAAAPGRTSSPLARSGYTASPSAAPWLIAASEKAKYDQFFASIDTQGRGAISGEQAVGFFSDSGLPEDTLASIWDLADINSEGQLNKDEFAVAMYLIRQQRASNAPALPAFLPPQLIPPSMRKPGLQQQTQQTTAPAFEAAVAAKPALPKSTAEDLFGLDEPTQAPSQQPLAPTATGDSSRRDPFNAAVPSSPTSPSRNVSQPSTVGATFKPFVPSSAFGASLAAQGTGGSQGSAAGQARAPAQPFQSQPSALDDLLSDNDTGVDERSKLSNDTTELANMSNQIGNLRTQMEQTQTKKVSAQTELSSTNVQKQDLEARLQQFRAQYEQEVRSVKDLEQQLAASRQSTQKLGQELALLEGTHSDLQTQHQTIAQSLHADQTENATLKQKIAQLNAEVAKLKPEIEKLRLDARQQKGMVSINKKQLATNEAERDRLQGEKNELERAAADPSSAQSPPANASEVISPAGSTLSATNPFFRKPASDTPTFDRAGSPASVLKGAPNPTAFDQLFGPSAVGDSKSSPPATSFVGRAAPVAAGVGAVALGSVAGAAAFGSGNTESVSSDGQPTPIATPTLSEENKTVPSIAEPPPPPPEEGQFTPGNLPVGGLKAATLDEDARSTSVAPPTSHTGALDTPDASDKAFTPANETVPGAFPNDVEATKPAAVTSGNTQADFDSAFASFGSGEKSTEAKAGDSDPFATSLTGADDKAGNGFTSEFPPIQSLELEDEDSESDDDAPSSRPADAFGTSSTAATSQQAASSSTTADRPGLPSSQSTASDLPPINAQVSPPTYQQSENTNTARSGSNDFPKEFTGLLPAREQPEHAKTPPLDTTFDKPTDAETPRAVPVKRPSYPTPTPTSTVGANDIFHDASSRPLSSVTDEDSGVITAEPQSLDKTAVAPSTSNAFDEFDDFNDLADAKEAEKGGGDFDFGFGGHTRNHSDFDAAFDSPAASTVASRAPTAASNGPGHEANGFAPSASVTSPFNTSGTANSSIQNTPQASHDWDAIFAGLDNPTTETVDTSFGGNDPWVPTNGPTSASSAAGPSLQAKKAAEMGRAVTPGTEHDDPILKRLTGMGYARADALNALEMYDYDISKAVDHLSTK